jgi:hypothetical protein
MSRIRDDRSAGQCALDSSVIVQALRSALGA